MSRTLPGLGNASEVIAWTQSAFDKRTARALLLDNGRVVGVPFSFKETVDDGDDLGAPVSAYRSVADV